MLASLAAICLMPGLNSEPVVVQRSPSPGERTAYRVVLELKGPLSGRADAEVIHTVTQVLPEGEYEIEARTERASMVVLGEAQRTQLPPPRKVRFGKSLGQGGGAPLDPFSLLALVGKTGFGPGAGVPFRVTGPGQSVEGTAKLVRSEGVRVDVELTGQLRMVGVDRPINLALVAGLDRETGKVLTSTTTFSNLPPSPDGLSVERMVLTITERK